MSEIRDLDRAWKKAMDDLAADWRREYLKLQKDYEKRLAELEKSKDDLVETLKRYEKEYKEAIEELNRRYTQSIDRITKEFNERYRKDREELEGVKRQLESAIDRYSASADSLDRFREEMEEAGKSIRQEYENATVLLKKGIDERVAKLLGTIDKARVADPRLDEHSEGRVGILVNAIHNIRLNSESDRYYHYSEMLVLSRQLSDMVTDVRFVLDRAEEVNRMETEMTLVRNMVLGHLRSNTTRYTVVDVQQDRPWTTLFVQYYDREGNVYRIFADPHGFQSEVWPQREDGRVRAELKRRMDAEIGGLYDRQEIEIEEQCNSKANFITAAKQFRAKNPEKRRKNRCQELE